MEKENNKELTDHGTGIIQMFVSRLAYLYACVKYMTLVT